jgi:hypothetical protein
MDITVEVMLPPRGETFATLRNGRYMVLMPVAVYPLKVVDAVGMQRTGYIHVTGVPNRISIVRANEVLCRQDDGTDERRVWKGDPAMVPSAARQALLNDRQITVTFAQFRAVLSHLVEARELAEADFD